MSINKISFLRFSDMKYVWVKLDERRYKLKNPPENIKELKINVNKADNVVKLYGISSYGFIARR